MLPLTSTQLNAARVGIVLHVGYDDPTTDQNKPHRGPDVPELSIDGYVLQFDTPCDGYTLNIVNGDDEVEYTTVVPTGATSLVLPSTLEGEYTME